MYHGCIILRVHYLFIIVSKLFGFYGNFYAMSNVDIWIILQEFGSEKRWVAVLRHIKVQRSLQCCSVALCQSSARASSAEWAVTLSHPFVKRGGPINQGSISKLRSTGAVGHQGVRRPPPECFENYTYIGTFLAHPRAFFCNNFYNLS